MTVLLGIKDEYIKDSTITGWETSKIGGYPNWMKKSCCIPSCSVCGQCMYLVLQIYCPLERSLYHRIMYVFVCVTKQCWSKQHGWKIFRSQSPESKEIQESANPKWTESAGKNNITDSVGEKEQSVDSEKHQSWCDEADDWGAEDDIQNDSVEGFTSGDNKLDMAATNDGSSDDLEEFREMNLDDFSDNDTNCQSSMVVSAADDMILTESSADILRNVLNLGSDAPQEHGCLTDHASSDQKPQEALPGCYDNETDFKAFESFYLSVVDETFYKLEEDKHMQSLLQQYQDQHGADWDDVLNTGSSCKKASGEQYEKDQLKHGDKMFHKFMKQVSLCSNQLIRYNWNGCPLLMAPLKKVDSAQPLSHCQYCKGERVYELQLMPALVTELKFPDVSDPVIEFGTVIIFTCKNSCWDDEEQYREEALYIQEDPDQHMFK